VAAELLSQTDGPRIAVMESQGWDTHFNQKGRLEGLFKQLAIRLTALKRGLGQHWSRTTVLVVSEFGRTVAENGTRGTDHGVGGIGFLLGGSVRGGRVVTDWPGLEEGQRFEGRDLMPTLSYESVFKAVLEEHLGLKDSVVEDQIFPNTRGIAKQRDLFS